MSIGFLNKRLQCQKVWWKKWQWIEVERKPGGKKAWSFLEKMGKKPGALFSGLIHTKINDQINRVPTSLKILEKIASFSRP